MFRKLGRGEGWKRDKTSGASFALVFRRSDYGVDETIQLSETFDGGAWGWQAARGADARMLCGEAPSRDAAWLMAIDAIVCIERDEQDELLAGSVGG